LTRDFETMMMTTMRSQTSSFPFFVDGESRKSRVLFRKTPKFFFGVDGEEEEEERTSPLWQPTNR
jgi:hypothetical protein